MRRRKRHHRRNLHIRQQVWQYTIGSDGVKLFHPDGTSSYVDHRQLFPGEDTERARYKRCFHVLPSQIKTYIEDYVLP